MAIVLLVTSEFLSPSYGEIGMDIDRERLYQVSVSMGLIFILYAGIRLAQMVLG